MNIGEKVQYMVLSIITAVILLVIGVSLIPTVIDAAADINATTLSGVVLADVLILIGDYIPFFFVLAVVIGALIRLYKAGNS